jgi:hypothetical protein
MQLKHCPICDKEQVVEQPPCADGHDDCPEWLCVECGAALLAGFVPGAATKRSAGSAA